MAKKDINTVKFLKPQIKKKIRQDREQSLESERRYAMHVAGLDSGNIEADTALAMTLIMKSKTK